MERGLLYADLPIHLFPKTPTIAMTLHRRVAILMIAFGVAFPWTSVSMADVLISSNAPTVDEADIANLIWDNNPGDEKLFSDTANPGQSFTTGSDPSGYTVSSFSMQVNRDSDMTTGYNARTWNIRVVEIDGSNNTNTLSFETGHAQAAGMFSVGDWFTWTLFTPVSLSANTLYGIDVEHVTGSDWQKGLPYMRREGNDYAGGSLYQRSGGVNGDGDQASINPNTGRDFIFHINLASAAVPEPTAFSMLGLASIFLTMRRRRV